MQQQLKVNFGSTFDKPGPINSSAGPPIKSLFSPYPSFSRPTSSADPTYPIHQAAAREGVEAARSGGSLRARPPPPQQTRPSPSSSSIAAAHSTPRLIYKTEKENPSKRGGESGKSAREAAAAWEENQGGTRGDGRQEEEIRELREGVGRHKRSAVRSGLSRNAAARGVSRKTRGNHLTLAAAAQRKSEVVVATRGNSSRRISQCEGKERSGVDSSAPAGADRLGIRWLVEGVVVRLALAVPLDCWFGLGWIVLNWLRLRLDLNWLRLRLGILVWFAGVRVINPVRLSEEERLLHLVCAGGCLNWRKLIGLRKLLQSVERILEHSMDSFSLIYFEFLLTMQA